MGYIVEISVNVMKETKYSDIEMYIQEIATYYNCSNIYVISEEDGTQKIPRYHNVITIVFSEEQIENLIKFIKIIKNNRKGYVECIYNDLIYKVIYASSYYLKNLTIETSNKYKKFINSKQFTENENKLLRVLTHPNCII